MLNETRKKWFTQIEQEKLKLFNIFKNESLNEVKKKTLKKKKKLEKIP